MEIQRHVIKRQVVELPLSSSNELQLREQQFKQLYYQHLLPVIEKFFNQYAKSDFHYQLDRIKIEIEDFDWDNLKNYYHIIRQLERQLRLQIGKHIPAQTKVKTKSETEAKTKTSQSTVVKLQPKSKTAVQTLAHFLQTGTLPWWAEELNHQQLDNWLQRLVQQEKSVIPLLRQAIAEPRSRKRCILQFSDTSLWHICQKLLPFIQLKHEDSIPFSKNGVSYNEIASLLKLDVKFFRVQHWDTLLELCILNEQHRLTTAEVIQKYWHRIALANGSEIKDWWSTLAKSKLLTIEQQDVLANIAALPLSSENELSVWLIELRKLEQLAIESKDFAACLTRLEKVKPKDLSLQQWQVLKQQFSVIKQKLRAYQAAVKTKRITTLTLEQLKSEVLILLQECQLFLLNHEQNLTQLELQENTFQQLIARLQAIYKLSPPSQRFCEVLQQLGTELNTLFKPYLDSAIAQRCTGLLEYAKARLLNPTSDHELLQCTQEFYGLIDKELIKLQAMVDYIRLNIKDVQQKILPHQRYYQSLQALLNSIENSIERQCTPLTEGLITELQQTTRALVATSLRLQGLNLLENLGQYQQAKPANTAAIVGDIRQALRELKKQASVRQQKKTTDVFSDVDEVFVSNAGLVILWPYLGRFFTGIGLLTEGRFKDQEAAERAAVICHYLVTPHEQPSEPSLVLNKLLCGLDLDEPIPLEIVLTEIEQKAIDELLSATAGNWAALKTTNPNALRYLFLQRDGSLQIKDGSYLIRVERKSHDILLEKLPWSIANIKLAWLEPIIRVEW